MAEYTVKISSKFSLFYEDDNAEIEPDSLLKKIADEKTQLFKEKVKKPKIEKSEKLKAKVEPAKTESTIKPVKKDLAPENQTLKSPEKKFEGQKLDGRPPRFSNKKGGADQQQNKENITSNAADWGTSGNDWNTSGTDKVSATANDNQVPTDEWTVSSGFQRTGGQGRGGPGGNRRGGGFGEFNGPRAPRNFEGRGEFRGRGRSNFNRGGNFGGGLHSSTEGGVESDKPNDFGDDVVKSEDQQSFVPRGGYRGGRGGYRRDDTGEGGEFRPRGRGRGRGRGNFGATTDEGFGSGNTGSSGNNAGTGNDWGTSDNTEAVAPSGGDSFDQQQNSNFGRGGRRNFGGGGFRGGRGGRGGNFGRGREFDRHSGSDRTGVKAVDRKDGAGAGNWGTAEDELKAETDPSGFENTEPPANWDADENHDDINKDDKQDGSKVAAPEPILMTLDEYKAKKKLQDAVVLEQLRSTQNESSARTVNDGFKEDAFKNMYEYRKAKDESEGEESGEEEEAEDKDSSKQPANKEVIFDFKFNDNDRRGGAPGGGFRGGRGGGFGRSGRGGDRGGNFRGGRGGRSRDDGEGGHNVPAANIRLDDETDFPTLKGN